MTAPAIRLTQAVVAAGERTIIDAVTFAAQGGERIALVGPNGAGKSTLLRLIAGMVSPCHGEIEVLGRTLHRRLSGRARRQLHAETGQIFQGLHLVQRLTVLENVLLGSLARNRSWLTWARIFPDGEVRRAEAALQTVGLIGKAGMRADRLSGGERQKAAIARLLMQSPRLVLADEPTAALDPVAAADVATMLSTLARSRDMMLLTVVHDPGLLPLLADRVLGLQHGRLVFDLPLARVDDALLNRLYRDDAPAGWLSRFSRPSLPIGENL